MFVSGGLLQEITPWYLTVFSLPNVILVMSQCSVVMQVMTSLSLRHKGIHPVSLKHCPFVSVVECVLAVFSHQFGRTLRISCLGALLYFLINFDLGVYLGVWTHASSWYGSLWGFLSVLGGV